MMKMGFGILPSASAATVHAGRGLVGRFGHGPSLRRRGA